MIYLELGIGGTIEWYPPKGVRDAMPAPTVELRGLQAAVAATADAISQPVAGGTVGARELTVTSTAGIVAGRRYWLGPDGPQGYEDTVIEVVSGTKLVVEEPLKAALTSVRGHRLSYVVAAGLCAEAVGPLAVIWRYTVGGIPYRGRDALTICQDPFALSCTEDEVKARDPGMPGQAGARGSWRRFCGVAERDIADMLRALQIDPQDTEPDGLVSAYVYRILYHRYRGTDRSEEMELLASRALKDYIKAYHSEFRP